MAEYKELELDEHIEIMRKSLQSVRDEFFYWFLHLDIFDFLQEEIAKIHNVEELEKTQQKILKVRGATKEYIKVSKKLIRGLNLVRWNIKMQKAKLIYSKKGENNEQSYKRIV